MHFGRGGAIFLKEFMPAIQWKVLPKGLFLAGLLAPKPKTLTNKRAFPRAHSRNLVKCTKAEESMDHISNLIDISETGMRFSSSTKPRTGSVIQMLVNLAEESRQVTVLGQVAWVRAIPGSSKGFHVGVSFLQMSHEDRELVAQFVKNKRASSRRRTS